METILPPLLHTVTIAIEVSGVLIIVVGMVVASGIYLRQVVSAASRQGAFKAFRSTLGRSILLGLEFLVAADIINTVAIEPTVQSVLVLAGIVLIRTFLSFSLEVEIEGRWPWQTKSKAGDYSV